MKSRNSTKIRGAVVLNAAPLKTGGGLQKTSSFLRALGQSKEDLSLYTVVVRRDSILEHICDEMGLTKYVVPDSLLGRLLFELNSRFLIEKQSICFTLSGPVPLGTAGHLVNVTECAYSNLLYPELDFWSGFEGVERKKKNLIDEYRRKMTKAADFWIFQTEVLRERAITRFGFPEARTRVVKVAPSLNVSKDRIVKEDREFFNRAVPKGFRLLFLNDPNPNKRLHLLPPLLSALRIMGICDIVVVCTMHEEYEYTKQVEGEFIRSGLSSQFCNIGPVPVDKVSSFIDCCDAICTLSVLESFSNNFIESWRMSKPLITTDADWSRAAAEDAALYVDVTKPREAAVQVAKLFRDTNLQRSLVEAGRQQLKSYSTPEEKLSKYLDVLASAREAGPCPGKERKKIKW